MRSRGFSLVEATIVVAIIALAAAIVIPSVSNITKAELRASASKISALVRRTYDDAALTGNIHRLVFDFESRKIEVESTEEALAFEGSSNAVAESGRLADDVNQLLEVPPELRASLQAAREDSGESKPSAGALGALFGLSAVAEKSGLAGDDAFKTSGDALELAEDVKISDIWVAGLGETMAKGKVNLYFFPNGYTQDAIIHLQDNDGDVFSVKVAALTGRSSISNEYLEARK